MIRASDTEGSLKVRYVGGPTAILEIGGTRLLTDPTFDPPGNYPVGTRTRSRAVEARRSSQFLRRVPPATIERDHLIDEVIAREGVERKSGDAG